MFLRLLLTSALLAWSLPAATVLLEFAGMVDNSAVANPPIPQLNGLSLGSTVSGTLLFDTAAASAFVQTSGFSGFVWTSRLPSSALTFSLQLAGSIVPVGTLGSYNTYFEVRYFQAYAANVPDTMLMQVLLERQYNSGQTFSAVAFLFRAFHGTATPPPSDLGAFFPPRLLLGPPATTISSNDPLLTGIIPTATNLSQHEVTAQSGFSGGSFRESAVPEPGTLALASLAFGALALQVNRRQPFSTRRIL